MPHPPRPALLIMIGKTLVVCFAVATMTLAAGPAFAQIMPRADGMALAPDKWLLFSQGRPWWYKTQPASANSALQTRAPTKNERLLVDRAQSLLSSHPVKAFALLDGDSVIYVDYRAPANADSTFSSFSIAKTVTSMAVGQAICDGKLKFETKAGDVVPQLKDTALGRATVRDLLRMASGAAESFVDSTIWTPEQVERWNTGNLTILESVTEERVSKAARGIFFEYKPGESFSYKSTDPMVLGLMLTRVTGMPFAYWVQQTVFDPMGMAKPGFIMQDREGESLSDGGIRLRLEDWIRFAQWIKRSAKAPGCFGDYVRAATSPQIDNPGTPATRKTGKLFGGYGYLTWTSNTFAPDTAWASGWGGQRISWHKDSDRMVVVFSNSESWMPDLYEFARDWNQVGR